MVFVVDATIAILPLKTSPQAIIAVEYEHTLFGKICHANLLLQCHGVHFCSTICQGKDLMHKLDCDDIKKYLAEWMSTHFVDHFGNQPNFLEQVMPAFPLLHTLRSPSAYAAYDCSRNGRNRYTNLVLMDVFFLIAPCIVFALSKHLRKTMSLIFFSHCSVLHI
jgi:hypothetical protein